MNLLVSDLLVYWYLYKFIEQTRNGVNTNSFTELSEHQISVYYSLVWLQRSLMLQTKRLEFHQPHLQVLKTLIPQVCSPRNFN